MQDPTPEIPISKIPPAPPVKAACELSKGNEFGAPLLGGIAKYAVPVILDAQTPGGHLMASIIARAAIGEIESQATKANQAYSELWLTESSQVVFTSYFIELPDLAEAGLRKTWDGLDVVNTYVTQNNNFHIAAPIEFRFVKGGDSAMSGTFSSKKRDADFVNLDLIAWTGPIQSANFPGDLLKILRPCRAEVGLNGWLPHNGKMYGFYDPTNSDQDSYTPPFNKNFLSYVTKQRIAVRKAPVDAFKKYRKTRDPNGLFYTQYPGHAGRVGQVITSWPVVRGSPTRRWVWSFSSISKPTRNNQDWIRRTS